ncbi:hypothetical protein BMS3Abin16_00562 [archaeon BMS3Abin16]|nr:hypothetical protein BMS3Abin16_00562 [archaeon BMS3Abin16]
MRESTASTGENTLSHSMSESRNDDPTNRGRSTWISSYSICSFPPTTPTTPRTRKMFVIFDPTTFPATISDAPDRTETIDDTSSGSEVPIDTIVTPTIKEGIPR